MGDDRRDDYVDGGDENGDADGDEGDGGEDDWEDNLGTLLKYVTWCTWTGGECCNSKELPEISRCV